MKLVGGIAALLLLTNTAVAQELGQGQARISARSDVRVALQSGPATNSAKLSRIGEAITRQIGEIRTCYRDVVRQRPEVQGTMRLTISVDGGGSVEVREDTLNDAALSRCTLRALAAVDFEGIRPPGAAFAVLTYTNEAAAGVAETRARREVEDR
ncbi:MAG: AgmX/PglI C-terminal domain-containing protein, partial [Myxococcota bacterium]